MEDHTLSAVHDRLFNIFAATLENEPKRRKVDLKFVTWNVRSLRKTEWDGMDWIELAQDRDQWMMNTLMNLRVP
jgi:hypothetical protein